MSVWSWRDGAWVQLGIVTARRPQGLTFQIPPQGYVTLIFSLRLPNALSCLPSTIVSGEGPRARSCALTHYQSTWGSSRFPLFPGGQNPQWFSLSDAIQAPLPVSVALGCESWCGIETSYFSWGTFAAEIPDVHGCRGQPSLYFHTSYQCLCGFFCKVLIIKLLFSWTSVGYSD